MSIANTSVKFYASYFSGAPAIGTSAAGTFITWLDNMRAGFGSVTAASVTIASNVATVVVSTGHNFWMTDQLSTVGPVILMSGATPSELNREWRIASIINTTTFTFITEGINDQTATGTIAVKIAPLPINKTFSGTNKGAYQFPAAPITVYYQVDDTGTKTSTTYPYVRTYYSMSDVDTGMNDANAVTACVHYSSTTKSWFCICSDTFFYLCVNINLAETYEGVFMMGTTIIPPESLDVYYGFAAGGVATTYIQPNVATSAYFERSFSPGMATQAAFQFPAWKVAYPDPNVTLTLSPIILTEGTTIAYRARLPGMYRGMHSTTVTNGTTLVINGKTYFAIRSGNTTATNWFDITGPWS
jgi:hypothetical protein